MVGGVGAGVFGGFALFVPVDAAGELVVLAGENKAGEFLAAGEIFFVLVKSYVSSRSRTIHALSS